MRVLSAEELLNVKSPEQDPVHAEFENKIDNIINLICSKTKNIEAEHFLREIYSLACIHFYEEEKLMRNIKYPFISPHIQAHNLILNKIVSLIVILNSTMNTVEVLARDLKRELNDHINFYDKSLCAYIEEYTAGRLGQGASSSLPS